MKWYEVKEQAAGKKRLMCLWYIYKILGKKPVKFIVFFVTFFAFLSAPKIRKFSQKNIKILTGKSSIIQAFKHFLNYSFSLVDKMEMYAGKFPIKKIFFENDEAKNQLYDDLKNKKGIYFLCSHLGNINAMRALFSSSENIIKDVKVNLFLETEQCKIFQNFINLISTNNSINIYPVENVDVTTSIEIKDKLDNGEILFIAGDRIAARNNDAVFNADFFNHKVNFPLGAFKFALILGVPIYFVSCVLTADGNYKICLKKFDFNGSRKEKLEQLENQYVNFLEVLTKQYPLQFYHFYDLFGE